jgi:hypothetical protein
MPKSKTVSRVRDRSLFLASFQMGVLLSHEVRL